ncbi:hypothetical protein ACA910_003357 [Epithemia clementina (nom. ined.)]
MLCTKLLIQRGKGRIQKRPHESIQKRSHESISSTLNNGDNQERTLSCPNHDEHTAQCSDCALAVEPRKEHPLPQRATMLSFIAIKAMDTESMATCSLFVLGLMIGMVSQGVWSCSLCRASESLLFDEYITLSDGTVRCCFILLLMVKVLSSLMIYLAAFYLEQGGDKAVLTENPSHIAINDEDTHDVESADAVESSLSEDSGRCLAVAGKQGQQMCKKYIFTLGLLFGLCLSSLLVDTIGILHTDPMCGAYHMNDVEIDPIVVGDA